MQAPSEVRRASFDERVRAPRAWSWLAFHGPRTGLALVLAFVPALALLLAVLLGPHGLAVAVTDRDNVGDTFARFISGLISAAAIAVSVASLTMRRGIKGIGELQEHILADERFRESILRDAGHRGLPLTIAPFLRVLLTDVADGARAAQAKARAARVEGRELEGTRLDEFLDTLAAITARAAERVVRHERRPHRVLATVLDVELDLHSHLTRRFARDEQLPDDVRESLESLCQRLTHVAVARGYAKSLQLQWGLSRMSTALMLSSFFAVLVAATMTLAYGEGAVATLGHAGAAALVCGALFAVLLPIAYFVSYMTRFVYLNSYTLPIGGFALGPELEALPSAAQRIRRAGGA